MVYLLFLSYLSYFLPFSACFFFFFFFFFFFNYFYYFFIYLFFSVWLQLTGSNYIHFLWDHWAHCGIFENGLLLMYPLEDVRSVANFITAYEESQ